MDKITPTSHWAAIQDKSLEQRAAQAASQGELTPAQTTITIAPLELGVLLDRSHSMQTLQSTTLKAVNSLLAEQKQLGATTTTLSLMLFNHRCETVVECQPLAAVPDLTPADYQPGGDTALWDGIGGMIDIIGQRSDTSATHSRVIIAIITDGEENASLRYTLAQVRAMIVRRQTTCGWSFILIAPKAASLAFKLGIPVSNARNWQSDPVAITCLLERVSKTISAFQLGDKMAMLRLN